MKILLLLVAALARLDNIARRLIKKCCQRRPRARTNRGPAGSQWGPCRCNFQYLKPFKTFVILRILDLVDQILSKFDDFGVFGKLRLRSTQIWQN